MQTLINLISQITTIRREREEMREEGIVGCRMVKVIVVNSLITDAR